MVIEVLATALVKLNRLVHPTWFPYPFASTIHAARISVAFQANTRRSSTSLPWATYIAGYLVMCWGGTFLTRNLLALPQPMLHSIHPYINYITVHLALTLVLNLFPDLLNPKLLDTILFPLDALVRTVAITGAITLLSIPSQSASVSVHPTLLLSPLTHMIIGALASSGGGLTAATLSTWTPSWSFSTPPLFRAGTGLWGSVDFWGGALVAAIHGVATRHEAFSDITAASDRTGVLSMKGTKMDSLQAQALAAAVLSVLFGVRVWKVHWSAGVVLSDKKGVKNKVQ